MGKRIAHCARSCRCRGEAASRQMPERPERCAGASSTPRRTRRSPGALVAASSPSQSASALTDASGSFSFISLQPDAYAVSVSKAGYEPQSQPGVPVVADQSANVTVRAAARAQDHCAHDVALRAIARSLGHNERRLLRQLRRTESRRRRSGSGSLTQAYGAIASAPGVSIPSNQQGWYQSVYVRGGDVDQVAYEFDGLPTTRQSDLHRRNADLAWKSRGANLYRRHAGNFKLIGLSGLHQPGHKDRHLSGLRERRLLASAAQRFITR